METLLHLLLIHARNCKQHCRLITNLNDWMWQIMSGNLTLFIFFLNYWSPSFTFKHILHLSLRNCQKCNLYGERRYYFGTRQNEKKKFFFSHTCFQFCCLILERGNSMSKLGRVKNAHTVIFIFIIWSSSKGSKNWTVLKERNAYSGNYK